ncbi:MAG: hypothetical protein HQK65_09845, partial [Desulfamplus sp.]|nr:hypothetical protein [Desulfamplus sp.]
MSDSTDDNPLFSQDDIDKLLNAESIEEAEQSNLSNEDDLIGELSQDDIDRMLNASSAVEESGSASQDNSATDDIAQAREDDIGKEDDDFDFGELSQDDIDRMLNAASSAEEPEIDYPDVQDRYSSGNQAKDDGAQVKEADVDLEDDDDDLGELSQDDIDKMLNAKASDELDTTSVTLDDFEDDGGAFDLVSQDDIDKLMGAD